MNQFLSPAQLAQTYYEFGFDFKFQFFSDYFSKIFVLMKIKELCF